MPAGNVGNLSVGLSADVAQFQGDMGKAAAIAEREAKRIEKAIGGADFGKTLLGGLSVAGIAAWAEGINRAAEDLHSLGLETGSSVENLSKLSNQAQISGTPFEFLRTAIERLAAGMGGTEDGTTKTADALRFLGITARDPAQALNEVAVKLEGFADGAGKAAIARDLFGRGGVQMIATLHEMAATQGQVNTVTTEQAEAATRLAESYRGLVVNSTALRDALLNDVVPALSEVVAKFNAAKTRGEGFFDSLKTFAHLSPFSSAHDDVERLNKELGDLDARIATLKAKPPLKIFGIDTHANDTGNLEAERARIAQALNVARAVDFVQNPVGPPESLMTKPALKYKSSGDGALDDPTKKILEGQLKALDASIDEEKSLLSARNEYLSQYLGAGLISIEDFYKGQRNTIQEGVEFQRSAYAEELADLQAYINKTGITEVNRADARNKVVEVTKKLQLAEQEAAKAGTVGWFENQRAVEAYRKSVDDVTAQLLTLQGNSGAATRLQLTDQFADQRRAAVTAGNTGLAGKIDDIIDRRSALATLSDETRKYNGLLEDLATAQQRVDTQVNSGAITDLDALNQRSDLARHYVSILGDELRAEQAIVATMQAGPDRDAAIRQIEREKAAIDDLAAATDQLRKSFQGDFSASFSDALTSLATGTKSLKDTFNDLIKSIDQKISKRAADAISDELFGKNGPLGGIPDFFAKIFGGKGGDQTGGPSGSVIDFLKNSTGINPNGGTLGDILRSITGGGNTGFSAPQAASDTESFFGFGKQAADASATATLTAAGSTLTGAGTLLTGSGTTLTTAGTLLTSAAAQLQAAAASLAASSAGGGLGNVFGGGGGGFSDPGIASDTFSFFGFEKGTDSAPGGPALVGERGAELVNLAPSMPNAVLRAALAAEKSVSPAASSVLAAQAAERAPAMRLIEPGPAQPPLRVVGANGPELVRLPRGAQVIPHDIVRLLEKSERVIEPGASNVRSIATAFAESRSIAIPPEIVQSPERDSVRLHVERSHVERSSIERLVGRQSIELNSEREIAKAAPPNNIVQLVPMRDITRERDVIRLGSMLGLPAFAAGTDAAPGGLAVVGENGPEIVNLPRGAQVVPNNVLRASDIASLLDLPQFASGTAFAPGGLALVGERGPEIVAPKGNIVPRDVLQSRRASRSFHQTINVTIAGNATTKTADQIAVEVGRQTRRAIARNG